MYTQYESSSLTVYQSPKSATGERRVLSVSRHERKETIEFQQEHAENDDHPAGKNINDEPTTVSQRLLQNAEQRGFVRRLLKQCSELASIERRKLWPADPHQQRNAIADIVLDRYAIVFVDQLIRVAFRLITSSPIRAPHGLTAGINSASNCDLHDVEQIFSEGTLGFMAEDLAQTIYEELFLLALRVLACHEKNIKKADTSGRFKNRPEMLIFVTVFSSSAQQSTTATPADSDAEGVLPPRSPTTAARRGSNDSAQSSSTLATDFDELEICTRGERAMEAFAQLLLQQIVTYADNLADRAQKFVESVFADNSNTSMVPPATPAAPADSRKQQNVASTYEEQTYAADDIRLNTPKWQHNHLPNQPQVRNTRTNNPPSQNNNVLTGKAARNQTIDSVQQRKPRRPRSSSNRVMSPGADTEMEQVAFENSLAEVVSSEKLCSIIIGEVMYKSYAVYNRELRQLADLPADLPALLLVKGSADMLQVKAMLRHALCDPNLPSSSDNNHASSTSARGAADSKRAPVAVVTTTSTSTSFATPLPPPAGNETITPKVRIKKAKQMSAVDLQQQYQQPSAKPVRKKHRESAAAAASQAAVAAAQERLLSDPSQQWTKQPKQRLVTTKYNKSATQLSSSVKVNNDTGWKKSTTKLSEAHTTMPVTPSASKKRKRVAPKQPSLYKINRSRSRVKANSRGRSRSAGVPFSSSYARQTEIRQALTTEHHRRLLVVDRPLSEVLNDWYITAASFVRRVACSMPSLLQPTPSLIIVPPSTDTPAARFTSQTRREVSVRRFSPAVQNSPSPRRYHPNDIVIPTIAAMVALVICWKVLRKLEFPCIFRNPPVCTNNYHQPWFSLRPIDGAPCEAAAPHVLGVARR